MANPDFIYQALALKLISLTQAAILRVLRRFRLSYEEVFPSLATIQLSLADSGVVVTQRTIRAAIASLEVKLGVTIREPVFEPYLGGRRQTSNRYHIQEALDALKRLVDAALLAASRAARRVAAAVKSAARSVSVAARSISGGSSGGTSAHIERSDLDLNKNPNPDTQTTNNKQKSVVVATTKDSSQQQETSIPSDSDLRDALTIAKAWKLAGSILQASRDRLVAAIRYVEHRMQLHQQHPDLVAEVASPGAYVAALLRNPDADLAIKTPPKVLAAEKRKASLALQKVESKVPGTQVTTALSGLQAELLIWAGEHQIVAAKKTGQAIEELSSGLADELSWSEVERIERKLHEEAQALVEAVAEAHPEEVVAAKKEALQEAAGCRSFLSEQAVADLAERKTAKLLAEKLGLPSLSLFAEAD